MKYKYKWIAAAMSLGFILTACAAQVTEGDTEDGIVRENMDNEMGNDIDNGVFQGETTIIDTENAFSNRDLSGEYDESKCEKITLSDNGIMTDSAGANADGNTVTINKEGTYMIDGAAKDGMIIVDVDKSEKVQLVLNGVDITSAASAPIYIKKADKVFITLAAGTANTLTNGGAFEAADDSNIDAVIFSKDDLTLNGTGSLTISSPAGHGIVSKNELVVTNGAYQITALSHGLSAKEIVAIADGSFDITAGKDAIHSEDDKDDTVGHVYIKNGSFRFAAESDGISAVNEINIAGGSLEITKSSEGLEARLINISGGSVDITSSDDGMNATDKRASGQAQTAQNGSMGGFGGMGDTDKDANIHISGGIINVNAEGDGIDSNGYITVSGGEVYVLGSSGGGDAALDYGISAVISGGTVVAAGQSGMAVNFCDGSAQGSILVNIQSQQQPGTDVALLDSGGKELIARTIEKGYNSVVVSCPGIADGGVYTLKMGTEETQVTMDGLIYGEGRGMGGHGGGRGGMKDGFDPQKGGRGHKGEMPQDGEIPQDGEMPRKGEWQNGERRQQ